MLQITRSGPVFSGSDEDIERARTHFEREDWVRLPAVLDRELLKMIQQQLSTSDFEEKKSSSIYPEVNVSDGALLVLLNSPRLFEIIAQITGVGHIGCFRGRIYRFAPGAKNLLEWHSDLNGTRLLALTVNLNEEVYQGGVLSIRETKSGRIRCKLTNSGFGDAILFRIDERLEHSVSDVEGTVAKTALAGWFESEPDYRTLLAEGVARSLRKTM
jgi:hypothetical protein